MNMKSLLSSLKPKSKLLKLKGLKKKVIVTAEKEFKFRKIFEREMDKEFWYAYKVARFHLIHKPVPEIKSELKRVQRQYRQYLEAEALHSVIKNMKL